MNILLLGAGGFIGAHLTKALLASGHSVTGLDKHSDKIKDSLGHPLFHYIDDDIRTSCVDLGQLVDYSDVVVNLIAYANPGLYVKIPLEVFRLNFTENLRVADACLAKAKRLIQFSSCEVYGKTVASLIPELLPDPEDARLATFAEDETPFILGPVGKHRWIYACAKQLMERVLHAYGLERGLNYSIIRPFNFIGPKIDYLPGDMDGVPRVFSYFMQALLDGGETQLVNGGTHRRCYTYIDDAVDCISRIIENPGGVCDRQIFNIGSPFNEVSIRDLAGLMCAIYVEDFGGRPEGLPRIVEVSGEAFYGDGYEDSDRRIPDITKARTLLGWEPRKDLRSMLRDTMAYYLREYRRAER